MHLDSSEDGEQQPYVLAWQHMSSQRLGISDYENLAADANHLDHNTWPYPVIAYYSGQIDRTQLLTAADSGDRVRLPGRQCEAYAYLGEAYLARHHDAAAYRVFEAAIAICPGTFVERILAKRELAYLTKAKTSRP